MKVFKGTADHWGIEISYRDWDKSVTFVIGKWYLILVFHEYWKD